MMIVSMDEQGQEQLCAIIWLTCSCSFQLQLRTWLRLPLPGRWVSLAVLQYHCLYGRVGSSMMDIHLRRHCFVIFLTNVDFPFRMCLLLWFLWNAHWYILQLVLQTKHEWHDDFGHASCLHSINVVCASSYGHLFCIIYCPINLTDRERIKSKYIIFHGNFQIGLIRSSFNLLNLSKYIG